MLESARGSRPLTAVRAVRLLCAVFCSDEELGVIAKYLATPTGLLIVLAACACTTTAAPVTADQAAEIAADSARRWVMLTSYDGVPVWVAQADIARADASTANRKEATILHVLLKDREGNGTEGIAIGRASYDCSAGRVRELWLRRFDSGGRPSPSTGGSPRQDYEAIIPHTPEVVIQAALCHGEGAPPGATTITGNASEVFAYQARLRRERLGY